MHEFASMFSNNKIQYQSVQLKKVFRSFLWLQPWDRHSWECCSWDEKGITFKRLWTKRNHQGDLEDSESNYKIIDFITTSGFTSS